MSHRSRPARRRPARHRRRLVAAVGAAVLVLLSVLVQAGPAAAHASLIGSDPAEGAVLDTAPAELTFGFTESVTLPARAVQVFDAAGEPVASEAAARDDEVTVGLPDGLGDGTYVVTWRVVSGDGHPVSGSLTFSVGAPSATVADPEAPRSPSTAVRVALGATQGIAYVALFLAAGLTCFLALMLPAGARTAPVRTRIARVRGYAAAVAVLGAVLLVPLAGASQQLLGLAGVLTAPAWSLDLVADDLAIAGLVAAGLAVAARAPATTRALPLGGAVLAAAAPAIVGHTRTLTPELLFVATDVLHLLAGSVWIGGLVGLALSIRALADGERLVAQALARFSSIAAGVLALLVASGSLMAWRIVGSWEGLVRTEYGIVLLVKVGVVVLAVVVAAWNRYALLPRVRADHGLAERRRGTARLRRSITTEAALLLVVLLVTGFLTGQSPRAASSPPSQARAGVATAQLGDLEVVAMLGPQTTGRNSLHLHVQDESGRLVEAYAAPVARVRSASVDLGRVDLARVATGVYVAEVVLPSPGRWEVQVSLRVSEFENPVATLRFGVTP